MALTETEVTGAVRTALALRHAERPRLDRIHLYLKDPDPQPTLAQTTYGPLRWLPTNAPSEVRRLASISRVNMLKFVVNSSTQALYVDGYRAPRGADEEPVWETWQLNRMDARQIAAHRGALSYGTSYATVLPGDLRGERRAVIRPVSPRDMTAVYGDDDDWPEFALELRRSAKPGTVLYALYDDQTRWWVEGNDRGDLRVAGGEEHGIGVVPVVRFRSTIDVDDIVEGDVEPLLALQDQINVTTFGLMVAQHYGAFRQRYILGWVADNEEKLLKASAQKVWAFDDPEVKVGEFGQTDLSGYIESREATLRHLATVSQTPAHELLGMLVNLSAEALAAAERSHRAKVEERQTVLGEAWEQTLELAATVQGLDNDPLAEVRWRDTEARSLSQVADALGKLTTMLGIPPEELWEKIPGVTQTEVERWKATAAQGDAIRQLADVLERQAATPVPTEVPPAAPEA